MQRDNTEDPIILDPDPNTPYTLRILHQPTEANIMADKNEIVVYKTNDDIPNPQHFKRTNIVGLTTLTISANFQFDTQMFKTNQNSELKYKLMIKKKSSSKS